MRGRIITLGMIGCLCLSTGPGARRADAGEEPAWNEVVFRESDEAFPNPERGFYAPRMSGRMDRLDGLRERGITLLLVEMDLRDFKERDISPEKLDELRRAFAAARRRGLKVIFRAAYGFTGKDYRADPKDLGRIRGHIRQLGSVFAEDRDVLCGVQAGLLGPWGEWHGSSWGDPPSLESRREVLFGLLDAVPAPITVQVRRPMFIRDLFAGEPGGSELTPETAYSGSRLSRTGWHDDALLSPPGDMGTYSEPGWDRGRELRWCANHGRFTPFGGETVPLSVTTPIDQVVRELEQLHPTYLNGAYHEGTLNAWRAASYQGGNAYQYIERRLGYRFVADRLRLTPDVRAGGTLRIELDLKNVGFASPHLPKEVSFVMSLGERTHRVVVAEADPRRWGPEAGAVHLRAELALPDDAPPGRWRLALHLADPSPCLRGDGRYAIRLANQGVSFSEATGWNVLAEDVDVKSR